MKKYLYSFIGVFISLCLHAGENKNIATENSCDVARSKSNLVSVVTATNCVFEEKRSDFFQGEDLSGVEGVKVLGEGTNQCSDVKIENCDNDNGKTEIKEEEFSVSYALIFLCMLFVSSLLGVGLWLCIRKLFVEVEESLKNVEKYISCSITDSLNKKIETLSENNSKYIDDLLSSISRLSQQVNQNSISSTSQHNAVLQRLATLEKRTFTISPRVVQESSTDNKSARSDEESVALRNEVESLKCRLKESDGRIKQLTEEIQNAVTYKKDAEALNLKLNNVQNEKEEIERKYAHEQKHCRDLESKVSEIDLIYGLNNKDGFVKYLNKLNDWRKNFPSDVILIKSALILLGMPKNKVDDDTFMGALKDISTAIVSVMLAQNRSEVEVKNELQNWADFVQQNFSGADRQFTLQVPAIGANVDATFMQPRQNAAVNVRGVRSWAVYGPYAIKYLAEVV